MSQLSSSKPAAQPERVESAKEKSLQERDEEAAAYYMTCTSDPQRQNGAAADGQRTGSSVADPGRASRQPRPAAGWRDENRAR